MATTDKPSEVRFNLRTFSDSEIEAILDNGDNFREMDPAIRDRLLDSMRSDRWVPGNGECLAFDRNGLLVNGQHRLSAAHMFQRETGKRIWFWCADGVHDEAATNMDLAVNRKFSDYLRHEGVKRATMVASIVLSACKMKEPEAVKSGTLLYSVAQIFRGKSNVRFSIDRMMDMYKCFRGDFDYWGSIAATIQRVVPHPSQMAAVGFHLAKKHDTEAKLFFSYLRDGAGMSENDPILTLRERFLAEFQAKAKVRAVVLAAYLVKSWVAWMTDKPIRQLKWTEFGPNSQDFPSHIVG